MVRCSYLGFIRFPRNRHWVSEPHYVPEGYTPYSWILTQSFLCMCHHTVEKQVSEYQVGYRSLWQNVCHSFSEHTPDQWWDVWRLVDDLWPNFEMRSSATGSSALLQLQSICMVAQLHHWPLRSGNQISCSQWWVMISSLKSAFMYGHSAVIHFLRHSSHMGN